MRSTVGAASFASLRQFTFCLHRPALCRAGAPSMGTLFDTCFLVKPPAGPFLSGQKGAKEPVGKGEFRFSPFPTPIPLETTKKGELRFPLLGVSPEPSCWRLSDGGGLRCNAPAAPDGLAYPPFLGGTSNRGAAAPLIGRFKGWGVGAGEIGIPRLNWLFRPFLATQKGARRRHDKKTDTKKVPMEGVSARNKAGRCGHRPLRSRPGGHKGRPY